MTTDTAIITQDNFNASDLAQFAQASIGNIETHLRVLHDLAESTGNELVKTQVNDVWQSATALRQTAETAIDIAVGGRELALALQEQRDTVIDKLTALNTSIEHFDSDNPAVSKFMEEVSDECWEQWLEENERETYDRVQIKLTSMMILTGQVRDNRYIDVTQLLIDAVTGQYHLDTQSDDLLRQFVDSLLDHEVR